MTARKFILSLTFLCALFLAGCGRTPLTEEQSVYAGRWIARDGSWIAISEDGAASFEIPNFKVDGGSIEFTDRAFTIGLGIIKKEFVISYPPKLENEYWQVSLNGVTYRRQAWVGEK